MFFVHESSYIDDDVVIGEGTKIWHFSHIQSGARIGRNCTIGQNVYVGSNVWIGDDVKIQNNVSIYEGVTLEDGVFCGPSCVFTNDLRPQARHPKGREHYIKTLVSCCLRCPGRRNGCRGSGSAGQKAADVTSRSCVFGMVRFGRQNKNGISRHKITI